MSDAWTFQGQPAALGIGTVTLVEGASFCVCAPSGDIFESDNPQGVYYADTRLLSEWRLVIDDHPVEALQVLLTKPFHATFLGRTRPRPGRAESTLLVRRDRYVGVGMREDLSLVNLSYEPAGCLVTIAVECDIADLFEVKADIPPTPGEYDMEVAGDELTVLSPSRGRGVRIVAAHGTISRGSITFRVAVPARGTWATTIQVHPIVDGEVPPSSFPIASPPDQAVPAQRLRDWERYSPVVKTKHEGLTQALRQARLDIGALRMFDPEHPNDPPSIAAGAPWFMTLFGRDSLITSWMALPQDQSLAVGTLRRLARHQGTRCDPLTEEEPGRILHELRFGVETASSLLGGTAYYGSVDASPLFVILLGELRRWELQRDVVDELLPHADRALRWIEEYGDADGDGFVEYQRKTDRGLINQGWKDSFDAINFVDGTFARPPIALAEVQGYVYAAYIARSHFAREMGDEATARRYADKARQLRDAFNERFWLSDRGWFAVGLDADKRPIDALASNMGHCLWTGIVAEDKAKPVAQRLMSPEMFTGYGIRTLASSMAAYNPMSYHNGSVWPHDNALIAAGLMRYGFVEDAHRVALGLLDAAEAFGGRVPELFCGFSRREYPLPVPYPTACSPQSWSAATPIHLLRLLLRLDPWVPYGKIWLAPALPEEVGDVEVVGLPIAGARIDISVDHGRLTVSGLPQGIELVNEPRRPLTAAIPR